MFQIKYSHSTPFIMIVKKYFFCLLLTIFFFGCEAPPRHVSSNVNAASSTTKAIETFETVSPTEEYIMITGAVNLPLFVNHEQPVFKEWGKKHGVKTAILGTVEWDVPGLIAIIEQVIQSKPAGLLIIGADPGIAQVINKAVDAGIPTVVYDSDVAASKRHCFIGSDWYTMGRLQAERMVSLINKKGKVAIMGILGQENMEAGFRGFEDVIKKYPDIEYVGKFDDKTNVELAAKLTADLLTAHPDLAGLAGFDSNSGPGIGLAVKEAGKAGKVHITCVEKEPEHLKLVKEGVIDYLVGQKRELFSYLGAQMLFDLRHQAVTISKDDGKAGVTAIPQTVLTGSIEIDKTNVDLFIE